MSAGGRALGQCRVGSRKSRWLPLTAEAWQKIAHRRKNRDGSRESKGTNARSGAIGEEKVGAAGPRLVDSRNPRGRIFGVRYFARVRGFVARPSSHPRRASFPCRLLTPPPSGTLTVYRH